tara:strand:- start:6436 stop:6807 length:372 start_codon:yes stop_codon:yes gene_type:complete
MITIDNLPTMSVYEKNCAVAEQEGFEVKQRWNEAGIIILDLLIDGKQAVRPVDYCNVPNDYMPLAIKYGISINFDGIDSNEFDVGQEWMYCSYAGMTRAAPLYSIDKTGEAVVDALLMIKVIK